MFVPFVDGCFRGADGSGHGEYRVGCSGRDDGQCGSQRAVIEPGVEQGSSQSLGSDAVAVRFLNALDECVQTQATQVVGDPSRGELARLLSEQWSKVLAQMLVGECAGLEGQKQDLQQGLNARIGEAQRRGASVIHSDGFLHVLEGSFADEAVVTNVLDVEQTSVWPQSRSCAGPRDF